MPIKSLLTRTMIAAVIAVAIVAAQDTAQTPSTKPVFSLSISLPDSTLRSGSEVRVRIIVRNTTDHDIALVFAPSRVGEPGDTATYKGTVKQSDGSLAPYTELGRRVWNHSAKEAGGDFSGFVETLEAERNCKPSLYNHHNLPPRCASPWCTDEDIELANKNCGQLHHELVVSKLQDMSIPGQYTIQLEKYDSASKQWVKSNVITVTITR